MWVGVTPFSELRGDVPKLSVARSCHSGGAWRLFHRMLREQPAGQGPGFKSCSSLPPHAVVWDLGTLLHQVLGRCGVWLGMEQLVF